MPAVAPNHAESSFVQLNEDKNLGDLVSALGKDSDASGLNTGFKRELYSEENKKVCIQSLHLSVFEPYIFSL